ncbi:hypothetical protein RhiirA1_543237 [Rhizophagus irregularis]|uniref:Uncharacterized protein n=1 Tax=Rhizophagus irregularis TaxID=588596 RepID=A0A2N0QQH8_9GLOM|nr:hypothetical protein RhiirA1_543237 [Rhizophagus irregularis]
MGKTSLEYAKDLSESFLNNLYDGHIPLLHQQGYRIVTYGDWYYMLKWLLNPEYYRINEYYNNSNVNFVKSSEYARYRCKITGKPYLYDSLKIDYFKSEYATFSGIAFICEFISPELQAISTIWDSLILTEIHYITLPGLSIKQSGEKKFVYAYFPMLLQC